MVDEVLAVGDAEFQKKAIGKMQNISKEGGRTVLFVSHNMAAVKNLCSRGVLLENGETKFEGDIDEAINEYLKNHNQLACQKWETIKGPKTNFLKLLAAKVLNTNNEVSINHMITKDIQIEFTYEILKENELFVCGFNLFNGHNIHILSSHDKNSEIIKTPLEKGIHKRTIVIPGNFLAEGSYTCSFAIMRYNPFHVELHEMEILSFNVIDEIGENTARGHYSGGFPGLVRPLLNWK